MSQHAVRLSGALVCLVLAFAFAPASAGAQTAHFVVQAPDGTSQLALRRSVHSALAEHTAFVVAETEALDPSADDVGVFDFVDAAGSSLTVVVRARVASDSRLALELVIADPTQVIRTHAFSSRTALADTAAAELVAAMGQLYEGRLTVVADVEPVEVSVGGDRLGTSMPDAPLSLEAPVGVLTVELTSASGTERHVVPLRVGGEARIELDSPLAAAAPPEVPHSYSPGHPTGRDTSVNGYDLLLDEHRHDPTTATREDATYPAQLALRAVFGVGFASGQPDVYRDDVEINPGIAPTFPGLELAFDYAVSRNWSAAARARVTFVMLDTGAEPVFEATAGGLVVLNPENRRYQRHVRIDAGVGVRVSSVLLDQVERGTRDTVRAGPVVVGMGYGATWWIGEHAGLSHETANRIYFPSNASPLNIDFTLGPAFRY